MILCRTSQTKREINMTKLRKDIRHTVRLTEAHNEKLSKLIKEKGMTVSQWIRERIEHARFKC